MRARSTLDQFIERVRNTTRRGNEWVLEPKFQGLYVRYGQRYLQGTVYPDVLDIASVEVEEKSRRTGVFSDLVTRLRKTYPGMHLYVENAVSTFHPLLLRLGFVAVLNDSFFLEGEIT